MQWDLKTLFLFLWDLNLESSRYGQLIWYHEDWEWSNVNAWAKRCQANNPSSSECDQARSHIFHGVFNYNWLHSPLGFPGSPSDKELTCQCRRQKRYRFHPWVRKIPWRIKRQPTPVFLPRESHEQRSLVGYSPLGHRVRHDWSNWACTLSPLSLGICGWIFHL